MFDLGSSWEWGRIVLAASPQRDCILSKQPKCQIMAKQSQTIKLDLPCWCTEPGNNACQVTPFFLLFLFFWENVEMKNYFSSEALQRADRVSRQCPTSTGHLAAHGCVPLAEYSGHFTGVFGVLGRRPMGASRYLPVTGYVAIRVPCWCCLSSTSSSKPHAWRAWADFSSKNTTKQNLHCNNA